MNYAEYFDNNKGVGVLATSDSQGRVDAALYARPHAMEGDTLAFIMRDRLTHANLQSNPHAAYLFMESGAGGYKGVRLFLTKVAEESDPEKIAALRRKNYSEPGERQGPLFLVSFKVDKVLPLVGPGEDSVPENA